MRGAEWLEMGTGIEGLEQGWTGKAGKAGKGTGAGQDDTGPLETGTEQAGKNAGKYENTHECRAQGDLAWNSETGRLLYNTDDETKRNQ